MRADPDPCNRVTRTHAHGPILFADAHRPDFTAALELFELQRRMIRVVSEQLIRQPSAGLDRRGEPFISAPERRPDLGKSQLGRVKRFRRALAQGGGGELFQLRVGAGRGVNTFPLAVAVLLLKKPREIHNLARLVLGQTFHDADQFLGGRTHGEMLNRQPTPRNPEHAVNREDKRLLAKLRNVLQDAPLVGWFHLNGE